MSDPGCCKPADTASSCCAGATGSPSDDLALQPHPGDGAAIAPESGAGGCVPAADGLTAWRGTLRSAWLLVAAIPLLVWLLDTSQLPELLRIASTALVNTAPFIAFAVLLIAYLKATGAESLVAKAFVGRERRMIVFAAFFGGLAPFCSCEVIPFVAGLLAVGAPLSAVMAFWLSSPLIDPPSLMITAAALGWSFALGKAVAAILLGLLGGFGVHMLMRGGVFATPLRATVPSACTGGECATPSPAQAPLWRFWRDAGRRVTFLGQARENAAFLLKWLSLAYLLEGLLILYVPAGLVGGLVGGEGVLPIVTGALVGMPAYLNSYAAPPLVAGLMEQGMSAGAAMAFLIAGAISSIPAMAAVWSLVRIQVFVAYLAFGVLGAMLFALGFSMLLG